MLSVKRNARDCRNAVRSRARAFDVAESLLSHSFVARPRRGRDARRPARARAGAEPVRGRGTVLRPETRAKISAGKMPSPHHECHMAFTEADRRARGAGEKVRPRFRLWLRQNHQTLLVSRYGCRRRDSNPNRWHHLTSGDCWRKCPTVESLYGFVSEAPFPTTPRGPPKKPQVLRFLETLLETDALRGTN